VHCFGPDVTVGARVEEEGGTADASESEGGGETSWATAYDESIVNYLGSHVLVTVCRRGRGCGRGCSWWCCGCEHVRLEGKLEGASEKKRLACNGASTITAAAQVKQEESEARRS